MKKLQQKWKKLRNGGYQELMRELSWIGSYGYRYRRAVLWYILLGLLSIGMGLMSSVISKNIVDAVTGTVTTALLPAALAYVFMQLARIGMNAWTGRISAKIQIKVDQEIRAEVYDKIMASDWEEMSKYHSGDLLNRVDNDVASVSGSVLGWVPDGITRLFQFCGALGIILYYDATLAVLALASAPVALLVSRTVMSKMRRYNQKMRETSSKVMMFNEESFQNIQVIKSFGLGDYYGQRLRNVQGEFREVQLEYNKFSIAASSLMALTGTLVSMACFGWGVYRLWGGHITYGTMILFLQMAGTLSGAFGGLVHLIPSAISAATAAGRIIAVTELPQESHGMDSQAQDLLEKNREAGVSCQVEHMDFSYLDGERVFENADLHANPGEIIALVGPSGEGKTTMLRLLLGIIRPADGKITVTGAANGETMAVCAGTRRLFSYVPQGNTMFAGTIRDNLRLLHQDATDEEIWTALELAGAEAFVRKLPEDIHTVLGEGGGGLSQGQIQRLSIARALLADAPILLLDEATSALDVQTERRILRNMLRSQAGKTIIVTTHRPSVLNLCSRVYQIQNCQVSQQTEAEIAQRIADF